MSLAAACQRRYRNNESKSNDNPTHWKSASALGLSSYMQFEAEYFNYLYVTPIGDIHVFGGE